MKKIEEMDYEAALVIRDSSNATTRKDLAAAFSIRRLEIAALVNILETKNLTRLERSALLSAESIMEHDLAVGEESANGRA